MKLTNDTPPNGDYVAYVERLMADSVAASRAAGAIQSVGGGARPAARPAASPAAAPATRKPTTGVPSRAGANSAGSSARKPAASPAPSAYRAPGPPPVAAPAPMASPGAVTPPFNPASLLAGSESGAIVRAIFGVVGLWFALGILSSIFPEAGEFMPIAVIGSIVWLFFRIKKSVNPAAMAQWKTQLEKMAAEAARQQRNKQP